MASPRAPLKFGTLSPSGESARHRYPGCWDLEETTGPDRLVVAPASGHVALRIDLMRRLPEPFGLLYVLVVSRCDQTPARYQSPYPTYGPLEELQHALEVSGLARGRVELPAPHQHRYSPEFDDDERRILGHWPWVEFPLQPGDDPSRRTRGRMTTSAGSSSRVSVRWSSAKAPRSDSSRGLGARPSRISARKPRSSARVCFRISIASSISSSDIS